MDTPEESPRERAIRLLQDMMKAATGRVPTDEKAGELVDAIALVAHLDVDVFNQRQQTVVTGGKRP